MFTLPIEILSQVFITSANESPPDHFHNLCLVHPSLTQELKTKSLYGKFGAYTYRLDRLFLHPTQKSWITESPTLAETTILTILKNSQKFWKRKISEELLNQYSETFQLLYQKVIFNKYTLELSIADRKPWISANYSAHRLLSKCVEYNMYSVVRFLVTNLNASVSQKHLWSFGTKDMGHVNCLYTAFQTQKGIDKVMIRLLIRELGCNADCYDGYTTLLGDYIHSEDFDEVLDEEIVMLMVEGGADLAEVMRGEDEADDLAEMVRWARERHFLELEDLIWRKNVRG